MSEFVFGQDAANVIPYAAMVGGAVAGVTSEYFAQHRVAELRKPTVAEYGQVFEHIDEAKSHNLRRHVIAPLAIFGLIAGGFNGVTWVEQPTQESVPAQIEAVVDHSGATALNGAKPEKEIDHVLGKFADKSRAEAHVFLAHFGTVDQVDIKDVAKDNPIGDAPLDQATKSAIEGAIMSKAKAASNSQIKNSGVLAITNGNSLGSSQEIILTARANNVPVYIANVEDSGSNPLITADLQNIAKATYGKYWAINSDNIDKVAPVIEDALAPNTVEHKGDQNKWPLRILAGAATLLGFGIIYRKRSEMTLGNEVKKGKL